MSRRRLPFGLVVGLILLAMSGCQVRLAAGVDVRADGSGVVRAAIGLDDEALRELGDAVRDLRLDDLRQSGWTVAAPAKEADGLTWVRVSKPFADPAAAGRVAAELSGPDGPFRQFTVTRKRTFAKTVTRFTGLVDLTKGLAGLSDPALAEAVGQTGFRLDPEALGDRVTVQVEARLPGRSRTWQPKLGEQMRLDAESEAWNVVPVVAASIAVLAAAAALATFTLGRRRRRW